jgi:hypothetical protein
VTLPNCLWKISETKLLAFAGRELRYLKLFAGRGVLGMSSSGDLKNHDLESSGTHSHNIHMGICQQRQI